MQGFGCCGFWGLLAVGLFASDAQLLDTTRGESGLFHGGGWYLLGVQLLSALCYVAWSSLLTFIILWCIDKAVGIRMSPQEELLGADFVEHNIMRQGAGIDRALAALCEEFPVLCRADAASLVGHNSGHELFLERMMAKRRNGVPPSRRSGDGEEESVALKIEDEGQEVLPSQKRTKREGNLPAKDALELPTIATVNAEHKIKIENWEN